jgi:alpha-glucosidase
MTQPLPWWQTTTIYQIYPRSFADSNNDGIGDLQGIIAKLDYIRALGFETIWISPFFCSPQKDFGYDVSDYLDIAPEYGTLADAEELIMAVHARGMRILLDLVLNHTSDEHPWFLESRSSRDNPKRDWYIWKSGNGKRPPNNWKSIPGGSGWHYDAATDQYYFANFLDCQPDLNWRNPEVKLAMLAVVRFWLDKGVDGFRLDIFHSVYKDAQFRDNPFSLHYLPDEGQSGFFQEYKYSLHQPETFALARELRQTLESYDDEKMMVGEVFGSDETVKEYIGTNRDGFNMLFSWDLLNFKPSAQFLRDVIHEQETRYPSPFTPVYVFGNHDRPRLLSQIKGDVRLAKLLAVFQLTVRGVPVVYFGEEIGMEEGGFPAKTALDPVGQKYAWAPQWLLDFLGVYVNRDGCRTPMQWDAGPNAGFCDENVKPWLPVHAHRDRANVQMHQGDGGSLLSTYKKMLHLRRENKALQNGELQIIDGPEVNNNLLIYTRESNPNKVLVVINFGKESVQFQNLTACKQVLLTVGMKQLANGQQVELLPFSALILG